MRRRSENIIKPLAIALTALTTQVAAAQQQPACPLGSPCATTTTLIEQVHVADLLDPLRRRVMRGVDCAGNVVDEPWLLLIDGCDSSHVLDAIIGLRRDQVPLGITNIWINSSCVSK